MKPATCNNSNAFSDPAMFPFREILKAILMRQNLTTEQVTAVLECMMRGECSDMEAASLLVAWRMKGETAEEVADAAKVLRKHMISWHTGISGVLDTCGTGGDGTGTFNISTATALITAAAGVPVVKHGNRSVSSRSGSADVLSELGINVDGDATTAKNCLEKTKLAFCFAPLYHPALKHIAAVRKHLGLPTIFNLLGPLANPANANYQLLGVGRQELLDLLAGALAKLGTTRAMLVWGEDGLDEVTLSGVTQVRHVENGEIEAYEWDPDDFGLESCSIMELQVESPKESAEIIRGILRGDDGPARRIVLANTAAALLVTGTVSSLLDGVDLAKEAIDSGKALATLTALQQHS